MDSDAFTMLFTVVGTFVFATFIFKRALLFDPENFQIILLISVMLFVVALVLHFTESGRKSASAMLTWPLVFVGVFKLTRHIFVRYTGREPRDTFLDWTPGMAADRLFNISYIMVSITLSFLLMAGMIELAKRGW